MTAERKPGTTAIRIGGLHMIECDRRVAEAALRNGELIAWLVLRVGAGARAAAARLRSSLVGLKARPPR